jgi:hypothetical protein
MPEGAGRAATFLGDALAALGGGLLGHFLVQEGDKWKLHPDFIKQHAPHEFLKGKRGLEEQWSAVVSAMSMPEQDIILHEFMPRLSEPQQADVIIHTAELSEGGTDTAEKGRNFQSAISRLRRICNPAKDQRWRVEEMDSINWIKDPDTEYILVRLERAGVSLDHAARHLANYIQTKNAAIRQHTANRRAQGGYDWEPKNSAPNKFLAWVRSKMS